MLRSPLRVIDSVPTRSVMFWLRFRRNKAAGFCRWDAREDIRLSTPRDSPRELMRPVSRRANRGDFWDMESQSKAETSYTERWTRAGKLHSPKTRKRQITLVVSDLLKNRRFASSYVVANGETSIALSYSLTDIKRNCFLRKAHSFRVNLYNSSWAFVEN